MTQSEWENLRSQADASISLPKRPTPESIMSIVNIMRTLDPLSSPGLDGLRHFVNKRKIHFTENENEVIIVFLKKQQHPISANAAAHKVEPQLPGRSVQQIYMHLQNKQGTIYNDKGNKAIMKLLEHFTSDTIATGTFLAL